MVLFSKALYNVSAVHTHIDGDGLQVGSVSYHIEGGTVLLLSLAV